MSENTFPERIKFYQNHRPAMDPGEYTITLDGSIAHAKIDTNNQAVQSIQRFAIYGERFSIKDQDVRATFPKAGSTGTYESILPHIILNSNTLPWERHAFSGDKDLPWLALLLFDEDETPKKKVITVKDLSSPPASPDPVGEFPPLSREAAHDDDEKLSVIDVPKKVLQKILPSSSSLKLLAHTRQGLNSNHEFQGEENAVVFCNRLPEHGKRSTVHLVSLEGRYTASGFDYPRRSKLFRFVSLKSWEFYTIEHFKITSATLAAIKSNASEEDYSSLSTLLDREFAGTESSFLEQVVFEAGLDKIANKYKSDLIESARYDKTFDGLLKNLNRDILTLRLPPNSTTSTDKYLSQGLTPLLHYFRNGDTSVSWYHGPFIPYKPDDSVNRTTVKDMKPETADDLVQYDSEHAMFDVTYSAAWEIGRMLALVNKDFSVNLFQWKRLIAQHQHKAKQLVGNEHIPVFAHTHNHESEAQIWVHHLEPFLNQINNFENIPANYIISDKKLLPNESIRFFHIDKNWQLAALMGAFSVGGDWDSTDQSEANAFNTFLELNNSYIMGFLLRSDVLDGWPGLIIDGIDSSKEKHLPLRRKLSRSTTVFLFKAEIKTVEFYQKPEVMHFGLSDDSGVFTKKIRNGQGIETDEAKPIEWQSKANERVLDIFKLAKALGKDSNPAAFAMNMIEGVPKVLFELL